MVSEAGFLVMLEWFLEPILNFFAFTWVKFHVLFELVSRRFFALIF